MRLSQAMRLIWIDAALERGGVRRCDVIDAFGISVAQAAIDFREYKRLWPANIAYDWHGKCYRRAGQKAVFSATVHSDIEAARSHYVDLISKLEVNT